MWHALRYLLAAGKEGPGVVDMMQLIGKERTLKRLNEGFKS